MLQRRSTGTWLSLSFTRALVFEPQGPLVESQFTVKITDVLLFFLPPFLFSKRIKSAGLKIHPKNEAYSAVTYLVLENYCKLYRRLFTSASVAFALVHLFYLSAMKLNDLICHQTRQNMPTFRLIDYNDPACSTTQSKRVKKPPELGTATLKNET